MDLLIWKYEPVRQNVSVQSLWYSGDQWSLWTSCHTYPFATTYTFHLFFFCISLFFSSIWLLPFSPFMSGFASFLPRFSSLSFCLSYFAKYHNLSFLFPMRPKFACCINTELIRLLTMRERGISVVCRLWYLILINGFKFDIIIVQARIQWKKKCLLIHVSTLVNMSSIFALFYYSLLFLKI